MRSLLSLCVLLLVGSAASAQCGRSCPPRQQYAAPKASVKAEQVTVALVAAPVYVVPGPPTVTVVQSVTQTTVVQQTVIRK